MKTEYYPYKSAREIQNEIELIRRLSPSTKSLNRFRFQTNHRVRMAVAIAAVTAAIAATAYFWKP